MTSILKRFWHVLLIPENNRKSWRVDWKGCDLHRLLVTFWSCLGFVGLVSRVPLPLSSQTTASLAGQLLGSASLYVLNHQHAEKGSGDLGRLLEHWNATPTSQSLGHYNEIHCFSSQMNCQEQEGGRSLSLLIISPW